MSLLLGKDLLKHAIIRRSWSQPAWKASLSTSTNKNEEVVPKDEPVNEEDWFNKMKEIDIDERVVLKPPPVLLDHLSQNRKRQKQKPWWKFRYFVDVNFPPQKNEEYTEKPEYPPIFDSSPEGIKKQIRLEWYKALRRLPSVEWKSYEISKHHSHLSYLMASTAKQYNSLPIQQAITKTHLIHSLPAAYQGGKLDLDPNLKQDLLEIISSRLNSTSRRVFINTAKLHRSDYEYTDEENRVNVAKEEDILIDVVQAIRSFHFKKAQLPDVQVDLNSSVATSWWLNDVPYPYPTKPGYPEPESPTVDQCFLYNGIHPLHVRTKMPLNAIVAPDDQLCFSSVPKLDLSLFTLDHALEKRHFVALPGFWPSKAHGHDFPYLIGHSRENVRARKNFDDTQDVLDGMAIMSSFAWLTSIANHLGFTIYDNLTYPLVTQVVITDGQYWSFYIFQLNNHVFHGDLYNENLPVNLCWSSGDLKLFDTLENGKFTGLNEDVLKILVNFSTAQTQTESIHNLRPYLSNDDRPQLEKDQMSYSLRRSFASQTFNENFVGPRQKINLWEEIYKRHEDAPLDFNRVRPKIDLKYPPFFTGSNPKYKK